MTGTCDRCDGDVTAKNSAGHYRDKCSECIRDVATTTGHVDTCEREDCPVCYDYAEEFGAIQ